MVCPLRPPRWRCTRPFFSCNVLHGSFYILYSPCVRWSSFSCVFSLCLLASTADCINLFEESGFRANTHFYHLGREQGYQYHLSYETQSAYYFKCAVWELGCRGRAVLRVDGSRFRETKPHNHDPDPDFVGKRHFRQNVLDELRQRRFTPNQEIVDQERTNRRYA